MEQKLIDVFGLTSDASREELKEKYYALRKEYEGARFKSGAEGEEACAKIDMLDAEYREADEYLRQRYYKVNEGSVFANIDSLVKSGKLDEAQAELDEITRHNAQWYYLQAMVFYRRNWLNDARDQLKAAVELEPSNEEYKGSLNRLNAKMSGATNGQTANDRSYGNTTESRSYRNTQQQQPVGCSPCTICNALICGDCCCECMGGDCIACC